MYCVTCGDFLHRENQAGLVCQICKRTQEKRRRGERQPVAIRYCFRCGESYQPSDASIQHRFCQPATMHVSARKDAYVLL